MKTISINYETDAATAGLIGGQPVDPLLGWIVDRVPLTLTEESRADIKVRVKVSGGDGSCNGSTMGSVNDRVTIEVPNASEDSTDRFWRVVAHELLHFWCPLEGYHLLTGDVVGVRWDWREPSIADAAGIFRRNPGLRQCPSVDTQSPFADATLSPFIHELIERDIRATDWSGRGWIPEGIACTLNGKEYKLGMERENRFAVWLPTRYAFDLTEFLYAELTTGERTIWMQREMIDMTPRPTSAPPMAPQDKPNPPAMTPTNVPATLPGVNIHPDSVQHKLDALAAKVDRLTARVEELIQSKP